MSAQPQAPGVCRLVLPALYDLQAAIHDHPARFKVARLGRGAGKSMLALTACLAVACEPGSAVWYLGPSFPDVEQQWGELKAMYPQPPGAYHEKGPRLDLWNGSSIRFKSAHVGERRLRGGQRDLVVIDEAASIPDLKDIWEKALRPSLSVRQGRALFIGTPRGNDFFAELCRRGANPDEAHWAAWHAPSSISPFMADEEMEEARRQLPERVFQQEYEAVILEDGGAVFRRVREAVEPGRPLAVEPYDGEFVVGVDWGKHNDFTVCVVLDCDTGAVVELDRFNQIDYRIQRQRLTALCDRWRPVSVLPERNSIGEPNIEELVAAGLPIGHGPDGKPGWFNGPTTKPKLIEALALGFEQGRLRLPDDPTLVAELLAFTGAPSRYGTAYGAPPGLHDDCVIALALAWQARERGGLLLEVL